MGRGAKTRLGKQKSRACEEGKGIRKVAISLGEEELIWIKRILADDDREEAIKFIREVLEKRWSS